MSIKKSILFGLVLMDELMSSVRDPGGFLSLSYKNLYGFVPSSYRKKSLYSLVNRCKTQGDLLTLSRGRFRVAASTKAAILQEFPLLRFVDKAWDGKWRILGFDIEEEKRAVRNRLRSQLRRFGFGMLQKSVYVSPLPIEDNINQFLIQRRDVLQNAYIFVSEKFFLEDREEFIEKIFHCSSLNARYKSFLEKLQTGTQTEEIASLIQEFLAISADDPFLPPELLPKDFLRVKVWKALKQGQLFSFG